MMPKYEIGDMVRLPHDFTPIGYTNKVFIKGSVHRVTGVVPSKYPQHGHSIIISGQSFHSDNVEPAPEEYNSNYSADEIKLGDLLTFTKEQLKRSCFMEDNIDEFAGVEGTVVRIAEEGVCGLACHCVEFGDLSGTWSILPLICNEAKEVNAAWDRGIRKGLKEANDAQEKEAEWDVLEGWDLYDYWAVCVGAHNGETVNSGFPSLKNDDGWEGSISKEDEERTPNLFLAHNFDIATQSYKDLTKLGDTPVVVYFKRLKSIPAPLIYEHCPSLIPLRGTWRGQQ